MTLNVDTFLVALYTIVDDLYSKHFAEDKPKRPGHRPELSDSEVLTLTIAAQWSGHSERWFVRYVIHNWSSYFPRLLCQSSYNRRSRDLCGVLVHLVPLVAQELRAYAAVYQAIDTVPVPLMRKCRGHKHRLFADEAAVGRGGSDHDWYYGCKLFVAVTQDGVITGFALAPASTEDRWLAEAFMCWRCSPCVEPYGPDDLPPSHRKGGGYLGPTGPLWPRDGAGAYSYVPYIADNGFFGSAWTSHWQKDYGAMVLTPKSYIGQDAEPARRQHCSWRQVIETINGHLHSFGLAFPGARSRWGLLVRVAAKLLAVNMGIWLNRMFCRPDFAFATLFSF